MKTKHFNINLFFALTLTLLYFLYSAVLSPIYSKICSDIIWLESYLPYVLELLLEICQLLIWVHLTSCLVYAVKKRKLFFYVIFTTVLTLARYLVAPIINITNGSAIDLSAIIDSLMYFGADIIILGIVFLIIFFRKNDALITYCKFGATASAILISISKIATRIIFDIFYGVPQSLSEFLIMILYYFSDVVYGVAAYFLIYILSKTMLKEKSSH